MVNGLLVLDCSKGYHSDRTKCEIVMLEIIVRDLFHVYLNKFEFHFSRLHVNKINNFCFLLIDGCVLCMTK